MMEERIEGEMIASHGFCNLPPAYSFFSGEAEIAFFSQKSDLDS
jgi:hypothetical protein